MNTYDKCIFMLRYLPKAHFDAGSQLTQWAPEVIQQGKLFCSPKPEVLASQYKFQTPSLSTWFFSQNRESETWSVEAKNAFTPIQETHVKGVSELGSRKNMWPFCNTLKNENSTSEIKVAKI